MARQIFRMPIRSSDILGLNDEGQRSDEDMAADFDFQDNAIEDFLSNVVVTIESTSTTGVIAASMLAAGTAATGRAPVYTGTQPVWTDIATQAELDAHINDTTDAHAGTAITNTPAGNIAATTAQAAINELDSEKFPNDGVRRGTVSYTLNGLDTNTSTTVIFSSTFTSPPVVTVTPSTETQKNLAAALTSVTTAQFVVRVFPTAGSAVGTTTGSVHWFAIAP